MDVWIDSSDLVRRIRLTNSTRAEVQDSVPAETNVETLEFFDFGVHVNIQPPPVDQVTEQTSPPPCTSTNGSAATGSDLGFCSDLSGPVPSTTVPNLPRPTVGGPSALQFRPVESVRQGQCSGPAADPADAQPATLPGADGTCYDLGASALTIAHAGTVVETDVANLLGVELTLNQPDSAALDRLASANLEHQVAIVMFGRVLSAPTIQAAQFNGTGHHPDRPANRRQRDGLPIRLTR